MRSRLFNRIPPLMWILILGLVLRVISLNQSLWLDEATSLQTAKLSFLDIVTKFSPGDFHPPLYYLLLKVWLSVFGFSEVSARSMSVAFGLATIIILYFTTKRLFTKSVALVSALFLATSPLHIYYSQEARMYSLAGFLSIMAVWSYVKIKASEKPKFKYFLFLGISACLLMLTNYVASFTLVFLFFALFSNRKSIVQSKRAWLFVGILIIATIFALSPLLILQSQSVNYVKNNLPLWWEILGKTNVRELALVPVKFMLGRISFENKMLYSFVVLVSSALFGIPLAVSLKNRFVWMWCVVPLTISVAQGFFLSGFTYFRLVFLMPVFYLLIVSGLFSIKSLKVRTLLIIGIISVNVACSLFYLLNPKFQREDWRGAVSYIEKNSQGKSATIFVSKGQQEAYKYYAGTVQPLSPQDSYVDFDTIWLARYVQPIFDPQDNVRKKIESNGFKNIEQKDFNRVVIWKYSKNI